MCFLVKDLVAQTAVELGGTVGNAAALKLQIGLMDTCTHTAHGVAVARNQQHGSCAVHFIEGAEPLVKADAAEHFTEETHRGIAAAEGVGDVRVHILLVHAEPVGGGAGILELLVIPAEGKVGNERAGLVRTLRDQQITQQQAACQREAALPARTHKNGGFHRGGMANEVAAGEERAHRVSHQHLGEGRILLLQHAVEGVDVVGDGLPCGAVAKIDGGAVGGDGFTVTEVVVACHHHAVAIEKTGEIVIAVDILCHAVGDLQYGNCLRLGGLPHNAVELGCPVGGEEGEILFICHSNSALSVV